MKLHYLILGLFVLAGCRGTTSDQPPVHINLNMDFQEKYKAQSANPLFEDGRSMRMPIASTVARGSYLANEADVILKTGKTATGAFVSSNPLGVTEEVMTLGQKKFNIYCAPCHSQVGDGKGVVPVYGARSSGYTPPASFHQDRLRKETDGYLFDVVSHGFNNMAGYAPQIPNVADRWAIVAWVRALQRSQYAGKADVPADALGKLGK